MRDETLRWLLDAGASLASATSEEAVLEAFRGAVVPRLAERCEVELPPRSLGDRSAGARMQILVPLATHGQLLAVATLTRARSARPFTQLDRLLVQDIATRAALVLGEMQRRAAEGSAHAARATAERAVAAREDFLTIASHEFRTPLTTLSLHVDSLSRDPVMLGTGRDGEPLGARLTAMRRQVDRLTRLVHVLLDVSRASVRRDDLEIEKLDLVAVARDVVDGLASDATAAGSTIVLDGPSPVRGTWDRLRIEQVLMNLLANAIKFGAGQTVHVSVTTVEGDLAVVCVRDHGIGIAPDAQSRVFERFERAVSSRSYPGFGLGLWIVRSIVQAHGGAIAVVSAEGEGTTFTVTLPTDRGPGR